MPSRPRRSRAAPEPGADTGLRTPRRRTPRPDTPALDTKYDPASVEAPTYERWIEQGVFRADPASGKPPFTIVIPPPNVTGSLHLGHALEHTLMDALTRRKRMQGFDALWLPGMDHAGIATQNVVERELAKEGKSRHDLGREEFVRRVWQWKEEYGGKILGQMRRLGDGLDWDRERFTMDEGLSRAVRTIFKRLYDDQLIYRAERIINWCPRCMTALSDIEVEHRDTDGELVSISYGPLTVATTRAETMLGDTAVAVHPDDERYQHLIGTMLTLPLTDRQIPVVADEHVDPTFGTGAVKVTPAHDPNDFEIGQRHGLPSITVLDERGIVTAPGPFQGLDRFEARPAVVDALREQGLIVAEKRPYLHSVGHCSRCGTVVEPRLSLQWFVAVATLAQRAGDPVRAGRRSSSPRRWPIGTSTGSTTCTTGASAGSCGGATASPSGTARTARRWCPARTTSRRPARAGCRTRTSSTPGSPPRCGRPRRSAGRTRRPTSRTTTRQTCWSRATTSSSSGSLG